MEHIYDDDNEIEEQEDEEIFTSPFRSLLHRAISFLRREEEKLEQEMVDIAIENSMDTYHDTLFNVDPTLGRKISMDPCQLEKDLEDECHLCLETMEKGQDVFILPCQHTFHKKCIDNLIVHQHIVCPLCRKSIPLQKMEEEKRSSSPTPSLS